MARQLALLLGRSQDRLLIKTLEDLEVATGQSGVDVRLLGEILHQAHGWMRQAKLDAGDTTARELYQALLHSSEVDVPMYTGLLIGGERISFHLQDLQADRSQRTAFEKRSTLFLQKALSLEIRARYLAAARSTPMASRLLDEARL